MVIKCFKVNQVKNRTHDTDAQTSHGRQAAAILQGLHCFSHSPTYLGRMTVIYGYERRRYFGPGPYSMKDMLDRLHYVVESA